MNDLLDRKKGKRRGRRHVEDKLSLTMQRLCENSRQPGSFSPYKDNPYLVPATDYTPYLGETSTRLGRHGRPAAVLPPKSRPAPHRPVRNFSAIQRNLSFLPVKNDYIAYPSEHVLTRPGSQAWTHARTGSESAGKDCDLSLSGTNGRPRAFSRQQQKHVISCYSRSVPYRGRASTKRRTTQLFMATKTQDSGPAEQTPEFNNTYSIPSNGLMEKAAAAKRPVEDNTIPAEPVPCPRPGLTDIQQRRPRSRLRTATKTPPPAEKLKSEAMCAVGVQNVAKDLTVPSLDMEKLLSFCSSTNQLEAVCVDDEEELRRAAQVKPYAMISDEVKPIFFFDIKPKQPSENSPKEESDFNTPSFIESFRDDRSDPMPIPSENPATATSETKAQVPKTGDSLEKLCPIIALRATRGKGSNNIFINRTTIINNIINSNKGGVKRAFVPPGREYSRPRLPSGDSRTSGPSFATSAKNKSYCI